MNNGNKVVDSEGKNDEDIRLYTDVSINSVNCFLISPEEGGLLLIVSFNVFSTRIHPVPD